MDEDEGVELMMFPCVGFASDGLYVRRMGVWIIYLGLKARRDEELNIHPERYFLMDHIEQHTMYTYFASCEQCHVIRPLPCTKPDTEERLPPHAFPAQAYNKT